MIAGVRFYPPVATVLMALIPASVRKPAIKNRAMAKEKVHRRLNLEKERNDFMTPVIRELNAGSMTIPEIEGPFNTVIVAGSETTATILSRITNYLTRDSVVMNDLCEEIRSTFHRE
jgi:cytochrome P450